MRVLEICTALDGGGVDRYLLNYCSRIKDVEFDFAVAEEKVGILEEPLKKLGFNVYHVPRISSGVKKNYNALKQVMLSGKYDVVHSHLGYKSIVALWCAKRCGIPVRLAHSHLANVPENFKSKIVRKFCTVISKMLATSLIACGVDAGKWMWGEKDYSKGKITIFNNAIETERFAYSEKKRADVREELKLGNNLVFGCVGRISAQKNQLFAVDIFGEILKVNPDAVLLFVGRGEQEEQLRKKVKALGIESNVKMLGVRDDVPRLLNAFDLLLLPSIYEGLPFTLIESQCNGVMALSSDAVTAFVKYSDSVVFKSLECSAKEWAESAVKLASKGHDEGGRIATQEAGYDIDFEAQKLKEYYIKKVKACTSI